MSNPPTNPRTHCSSEYPRSGRSGGEGFQAIRPLSLTRRPSFPNLSASYSPPSEHSYAYAFPPSRSMNTRRMSGVETSSVSSGNGGGAGSDPYGSPMGGRSPYSPTLNRGGYRDSPVDRGEYRNRTGTSLQHPNRLEVRSTFLPLEASFSFSLYGAFS